MGEKLPNFHVKHFLMRGGTLLAFQLQASSVIFCLHQSRVWIGGAVAVQKHQLLRKALWHQGLEPIEGLHSHPWCIEHVGRSKDFYRDLAHELQIRLVPIVELFNPWEACCGSTTAMKVNDRDALSLG